MIKKLKDNEDYSYLLLLKLMLVSIVIGLLVGFVDTVFGRVLLFLSDFRTEHFNYLIPFLGIIGLLIVFLYQKADERVSKGMGLVFAIGQSQEKEIPLILVPLVTLATWLTHLFGGSAGREGVAVQLGAAILMVLAVSLILKITRAFFWLQVWQLVLQGFSKRP